MKGIRKLTAALAASLILLLSGCASGASHLDEPLSKSAAILDTVVTITLYDGDEALIDGCFDICRAYEALLSRTLPDSEVTLLNTRAISQVSPETADIISMGLYYSAMSDGSFDISIGSLTALWDFKAASPALPAPEALLEARRHVGWRGVTCKNQEVTFEDEGTQIDLGGIAKGYIADRLRDYLTENGVTSAVINLGGNVLCVGTKPSGSLFAIGLRYPYRGRTEPIARIDIGDASVVTTGVYERYFELGGKYYHHILDPETGYPYDNGLLAVTVVSDLSVEGDALSTACFAMGLEKGMELVDSLPGVYAIFITSNFTLHYSDGLQDVYEITPI